MNENVKTICDIIIAGSVILMIVSVLMYIGIIG